MSRFDSVVVSDLHLGARNARTRDFLEFLESIETDRLILAGDIFDDERLHGLRPCDVEVVEALRRLSDRISVEWLLGNHDPPEQWFAGLLGIEAQNEALLDVGGRTYLVYHGHGWDASLEWSRTLIGTAEAVYKSSQWLDPSHRLARFLKRRCKRFCRAIDMLRSQALQAAQERCLSGVILGHSHVASEVMIDGVHYLNCGCWTERPASFVGVRRGQARMYHWDSQVRCAARKVTPEWKLPEMQVLEPVGAT